MQTIIELTACELLHGIAAGNISVYQAAAASLEQAQKMQALNAATGIDPARVLARAEQLDRQFAAGERLPLHGLPLMIKDNIDTEGIRTTGGTPALAENIPKRDAAVVQRLLAAGALIIGKATLHELAFGITSNNSFCGAVRNPYDPDMIAGGSSGGSAAAVAARMVPVALGTDTGGSARLPAALCGTCGFRPSTGRYPASGLLRLSHTRDTAGVFARSVQDIQLVDGILSTDAAEAPQPASIKAGIPRRPHFQGLDAEVAEVIERTLARLDSAGVELVEQDIDVEALREKASFAIVLHECRENIAAYLATLEADIGYADMLGGIVSPDVLSILQAVESGESAIPAAAYAQAMAEFRPQLQQRYADYFAQHELDIMLMPTTILPARPIGHDDTVELNGQALPTFPTFIRNTDADSLAGLPSLSIPAGLTRSGLPVGLLIDGPAHSDKHLLAIGHVLEGMLPPLPPPAF